MWPEPRLSGFLPPLYSYLWGLAHRPALTGYTKPNVLVMSSSTWVHLHHRNGEAAWFVIPLGPAVNTDQVTREGL